MRAPRFGEGQVYRTAGADEPYFFTEAQCKYVDPEAFFPDERKARHHATNKEVRIAKDICGQCIHQVECAAYAIRRPFLHGIWGGLTAPERKKIREKHNITGVVEPDYNMVVRGN